MLTSYFSLPSAVGEVSVDGCDAITATVLTQCRTDHDAVAQHKLFTERIRLIVVEEIVEHWTDDWSTFNTRLNQLNRLKNNNLKNGLKHYCEMMKMLPDGEGCSSRAKGGSVLRHS